MTRLVLALVALLSAPAFAAEARHGSGARKPDPIPELPGWLAALAEQREQRLDPKELAYSCDHGSFTVNPGLPCALLALRHLTGQGAEASAARANDFAEKACHRGNEIGCAVLGWLAEEGVGREAPDRDLALKSYEEACSSGFSRQEDACHQLERLRSGDGEAEADAEDDDAEDEPAEDAAAVREEKLHCPFRPYACTRLGERALSGHGLPQSDNLAAVYFQQACDAVPPDGFACARLGGLHLEGRGVERSIEQARRYLKKGCAAKLSDACVRLAALDRPRPGDAAAVSGDVDAWCDPDDPSCGPPRSDRDRASDRLSSACDREDWAACVRLGRLLLESGPDRDPERAAGLFERACDADDGAGCAHLAWCYRAGVGVEGGKDHARGASLYERSCDAGYAHGCSILGELYLAGEGVPEDWPRAVELGTRACDGGCKDGCGLAGRILSYPKYAEHDLDRGYELLEQGCKGGDLASCAWQGLSVLKGRGTPLGWARGIDLMRKACDGDLPFGCWMLGGALSESEDPALREEALAAFDKACRADVQKACDARDVLKAARRKRK